MATDNDSLEVDPIRIIYPNNSNENEIIDALKQKTRQVHLRLNFYDDDTFNQSEEIRDAILLASQTTLGLLTKVSYHNICTEGLHTRCLDFFCQLLEGGRSNHNRGAGVEEFKYCNYQSDSHPLTLIDANKVAVAIASNGNIKKLTFFDRFQRGSFECVFNAVLDRGIKDFSVFFLSHNQTDLRDIDMTNLANNTTLNSLRLRYLSSDSLPTEFIEQFSMQLVNILKTNQSLEELIISPRMLNNAGREKLLNNLKEGNNTTLLKLDTYGSNSGSDDPIQSKINTELISNRIWKRYKTNYGLPAIILAEKEKETTASIEIEPIRKKKRRKKGEQQQTISLAIYPFLLEVLQNRPTHLYQFIQNENHRLCEKCSSN